MIIFENKEFLIEYLINYINSLPYNIRYEKKIEDIQYIKDILMKYTGHDEMELEFGDEILEDFHLKPIQYYMEIDNIDI